jgi:isopenicillin-N epimerase
MFSRRTFLGHFAASAATVARFNETGIARALDATRFVNGRTPEDVAQDEDFWFAVQQAFTVDRSLIYLNNGGVSPSPRIVQEAMRRYLEFSNNAPTYTMWRVLEPQKESVVWPTPLVAILKRWRLRAMPASRSKSHNSVLISKQETKC